MSASSGKSSRSKEAKLRGNILATRVISLRLYPNAGKQEDLRYTVCRYGQYLQHFATKLFFDRSTKSFSTAGMGQLANQAQHKAKGIISAQTASAKATGNKESVPTISFSSCPAIIELSTNSSYDYWVSFETQFSPKRVRVPAKSHKRLNKLLRDGWQLVSACEIRPGSSGAWFARVYLQKELVPATPKQNSLGVDVGWNHSVSRSDGYLGFSVKKLDAKVKSRRSEQQRQGHRKLLPKTVLKQLLDIEVRRAVARCRRHELNLVVEDPKLLANLRGRGKLGRWAKSYFANRAVQVAQEEGVWTQFVHPAYTSMTCSSCGYCDARNRSKLRFKCLTCGRTTHADINASRVLALKGSEYIRLRNEVSPGRT